MKKPFPREERADDRCPVGLRDEERAGPVNHLHWKLLTAVEPFWSHLLPQLASASLVFRGSGASRQRGLFGGWGKAEMLPSVILADGEESSSESGNHFHCVLKLHGDLTFALVLQNCCGVE